MDAPGAPGAGVEGSFVPPPWRLSLRCPLSAGVLRAAWPPRVILVMDPRGSLSLLRTALLSGCFKGRRRDFFILSCYHTSKETPKSI